jgi:ketosteroid isomerase-like protein
MPTRSEILRSFYAAIEAGLHGDALGEFLHPEATTLERPNALVPTGRMSDRTAMLAASTAGVELLESQRYEVRTLDEIGDDVVAARLHWRGVIAADVGPFRAGGQLTAHIAQFVRFRDDRILEIETFDCYEPFPE